MLVTVSATVDPAADLGFLLYKHPEKVHSFPVTAGTAHVFYPEATARRCTAAAREYALGLGALDRLAAGEPLRRVHERVFAALALESEPIDARL